MPTPYIVKMAEKHNTSVEDMEKSWELAKSKVNKDNYDDDSYYAVITSIFKKIIGEELNHKEIMSFANFSKKKYGFII